jgi:hypothetical protein
MNSSLTINNIVRFFVLLLVQVLLLKNIEVSTYIGFFIYPLFLILLPIRTPRALQTFLAFLLGLLVDVFYNTPGLHAGVSTFSAYMRDPILRIIEPRGGYTSDKTPNRRLFGDRWFWQYAAVLVFVHIFAFSVLELFAFPTSFAAIERLFLTYLFSLILIILPQYILPTRR